MPWKKTFISSFVAQTLGILGFSFCTPFLPFFVGELGVQETGAQAFFAGVALSSAGLTFVLSSPVWGILADRFGRKIMVCRAMFGGSIALLLMSFAQTVPQLVLFRLFQGVFAGTLAASIALVASVVPQHRSGFTLGMMQAAVFIGNAVGPFFGGLTADAFGYRTSFRIGALLTFLGGALVFFGARENFSREAASSSGDSPKFKTILLLPGFLISVAVLFGVRLGNSMANPSFPLIVKDFVVSSVRINSITGSVMAVAAVAAALSAAVLGHVGDRLGRRRVLIFCCLGASLSAVGHFLSWNLFMLVISRILFGFTIAGMLPSANAMIHQVVEPRSFGKAYGLATSLSMMGIVVGPTLGGFMAMQAGLRVPFLVTAAAHLSLALLVYLFFHDRRERS